jgi:CheY-like chemotaxis protein
MMKRILVRVVGFTAVERHALNTVFRLSQEPSAGRSICYEPWLEGNPESPGLALVDGASGSASQELDTLHRNHGMGLIWVGTVAPQKAWRTFVRPLRWPDVLTAMDMYFERPSGLDFDLADDQLPAQIDAATQPAPLQDASSPVQRALVADPDPVARLVLRTTLAALNITQVDEAGTVAEAIALMGSQSYQLVSIDLDLPGLDPWLAVTASEGTLLRLITCQSLGLVGKVRAKVEGCRLMVKPLHTGKLSEMLHSL